MTMTPDSPRRVLGPKVAVVGLLLAAGLLVFLAIKVFFPAQPPAGGGPGQQGAPEGEPTALSGKELYATYCTQCHGEKGNGDGPAARFLYPKPRNFGEAKFRLVSADNRMPTDNDLLQVVTHGMPGSAMFPFAHLTESERREVVVYVRLLMRAAVEERERQSALARGAEVDAEELAQAVERILQPDQVVEMPADLPAFAAESVARGRQVYLDKGCASCHGPTGQADGTQDQRNDDGSPTRPRDFTRGIFKGGRDPKALYSRVFLGMPGSPMPGSTQLKPAELGDLINFVQSLSDPASQAKVAHQRSRLIAKRAKEPLGDTISEADWQASPAVHLVVSPLWWRNYAEPDLHVAARHDGQALAIRLTWQDATQNDRPVRPQDFEDMAAVQLFKGSREPFLGMGAADKALDVWLWRPSWQATGSRYADVDTVYPNMAVDMYPFEQPGNGPRPHGTERQPPDFLTARAAGNLQSDPEKTFTGGNLRAKGFGSLTMQPRVSQVVSAQGSWKDGRWTVVLRRPLDVKADAGIPLAAGDKLSIAFALWDGAAGDRNGQKLVSIWHDLELE